VLIRNDGEDDRVTGGDGDGGGRVRGVNVDGAGARLTRDRSWEKEEWKGCKDVKGE